jgi:hypothetical protein
MAILAPEAYEIFRTTIGGSDALLLCATKRVVLPAWNLIPPEVQDGWISGLVGPPLTGEAMYALYIASVVAAEPLEATITGTTFAALPEWADLTLTVQAAWDAVAAAAQ